MGRTNQIFYKKEGLEEDFSKIFDFPLTVVTAPMGYGKSTAVKQFLTNTKARVLEIMVSEKRASAAYFWEMLSKSLTAVNEERGDKLAELGCPRDVQQVWAAVEEVENIFFDVPTVIVADDFHLLYSQEINAFIQTIAYENIKNLHIVLIGRKQPDLDLLEMQIKNLCCTIGQFELMFSPEDIRAYFEMQGYSLSEEEANTIFENTEGWISAIYVTMLEYRETGKIEDTRPVSMIIENIIFNKYSESLKEFFIKLSVMSEFSFSQALYVTEEPHTKEYLKELEETNAFVIYDSVSGIYRIHKLMNQFLYNRLLRRNNIDKKLLCERTGDWYLKQNQLFSAFEYYIEARQYEKVLSYLSQVGAVDIIEKHSELLERIFERISAETALEYPVAYLVYAYKFVFSRDIQKAAEALEMIERRWRNGEAEESILGEIYLAKSFLYTSDPPSFLECLDEAQRHLPKRSCIISADSAVNLVEPTISMVYYRKSSHYKEYAEMGIASALKYEQLTGGGGSGINYLIQAEYCLETAKLEKASLEAQKSIYKAELQKQKGIAVCAAFCLARAYLCQNRHEEGISLLTKLHEEASAQRDIWRLHNIETAMGYIYGCMDQLEKIPVWIRQADVFLGQMNDQSNPFEHIVYCLALLLEKNFLKLEIKCEEMMTYFMQHNMILGIIYTYIYQAVAKMNLYDEEEGLESLQKALETGEKDEIVMPFAEAGRFILPMLYKVREVSNLQKGYMDHIIEMSTAYLSNLKVNSQVDLKTVLKLSKREEEILRLMAQGMTNKEIAKALFLADITVGKTCSSIFRKLEVKGRVGAIQYLNSLNEQQ